MVKAEIRPPSSSFPEPFASAIKQDTAERAAEPRLPITDASSPCQALVCWAQHPGDPLDHLSPLQHPAPCRGLNALSHLPAAWPWSCPLTQLPGGFCRSRWHCQQGGTGGGRAGEVLGWAGFGWGSLRDQFGKGNLLFCSKAGKQLPWEMAKPEHCHFSGEKYFSPPRWSL